MIDFDAITRKHEEYRRKLRAADTLRERATDISVHITGMPHGGSGGNQQERIRVEMVAAQEAAEETRKELTEMKRQLRPKIKRLQKWQHAAVIRKRYLDGKTIQQVAEEIGYEWSQTNRYLNEAKAIINQA